MRPEDCKIGMRVSLGTTFFIGIVKDLTFIQNDYGGMVPSAKVAWIMGDQETWGNVKDLEDADAVADAAAKVAYKRAKEAMKTEPVRLLDPIGLYDGEPISK